MCIRDRHLEGQKHKKKAASATTDSKKLPPGTYKCELCDVVCTGKDAFNAHIKGANHGRVSNGSLNSSSFWQNPKTGIW